MTGCTFDTTQALLEKLSLPSAASTATNATVPDGDTAAAVATEAAAAAEVNNDRVLNALRYRLTRKRIAQAYLRDLALLFKELNRIALSRPGDNGDNGDAGKEVGVQKGGGGVGGIAEALAALGLAPPPTPPLSVFPAHLRDSISMLRYALLTRGPR
jgi:hypothetical protein